MKKILMVLAGIFLLCGCSIGPASSPTKAVEDYLNKYVNHDDVVIKELDEYVENMQLDNEDKETYKQILKKQYGDLAYEITDEVYNGDEAEVDVKITVYDLYNVQKEAEEYLKNNREEFNDENNEFDQEAFEKYRLDRMKDNTTKTDYTINITVLKIDDAWQVAQLSNETLQKIHGIYNYDDKLLQ